jgi:Domain of unknown function (DUF4878)
MKSPRILIGSFILFSMIFLISCGDNGGEGNLSGESSSVSSSSPSGVITKVVKNVADGDYESAIDLYAKKNGESLTKEDKAKMMALLPSAKDNFEKKGGLKEVKIIEENIAEDGNSAIVKYKMIYADGKQGKTEKVKFIKVNSDWKVRIN